MGVAGGPRNQGNENLVFVVDGKNNKSSISTDTRCAYFNGSNQYLSGSSPTLDVLTGSMSVGCWFYTTDLANYQQLVSKFVTGAKMWQLQFDKDFNRIDWYGSSDGSTHTRVETGLNSISSNTWHLVIGTYDHDASTLYCSIDGGQLADSSSAFTGPLSSETTDVGIGAQPGGVQPMNGRIDTPFVYNKALTQNDVSLIYNSGTGIPFDQYPSQSNIVNAWPLTETGDIRRDTYGDCDVDDYGASATTYGVGHVSKSAFYYSTDLYARNAGTLTDGVELIDQVFDFDGTDDRIDFGNVPEMNFVSESKMSTEVWVKRAVLGTSHAPLSNQRGSAGSFNSWINFFNTANDYRFVFGNTSGNRIRVETTDALSDTDTWYHLITTYDGSGVASGVKMYVNGSEVGVDVLNDNINEITPNSNRLGIGARIDDASTADVYFQGTIANAKVYNRVLTADEVLLNYQRHKNKFV